MCVCLSIFKKKISTIRLYENVYKRNEPLIYADFGGIKVNTTIVA